MASIWRVCGVSFVFVVVGPAVPCGAQRIVSPYRFVEESQAVGGFAGYVGTERGSLELGPKSGPVAGARYSLRLNGPFTLEAEFGYLPTERDVVGLDTLAADTVPVVRGEAALSLLLVTGALRFNLTGPRTYRGLQPYVLFAGGAAIDVSGGEEAGDLLPPGARFDFGTSFAGQVGGGLEWFLARRVALRADGRLVFWQLEAPAALLAHRPDVPDREWVQNVAGSVGVSVHF